MPPPIRTVFWDIGGVLLTNGWDHDERHAVYEHFGLDPAPAEQAHALANDAWEKGLITVWQYLDHTIFTEPRNFTPQDFFNVMLQQSQLLSGSALPVLHQLAKAGTVTSVMLNNESAELHDYRVQQFALRPLFQAAFCSAYVGLRKPAPEIFRLALRVMQATPAECAFIDDRQGNVDVANALGFHGIRFQSPGQLVHQLQALGLTLGPQPQHTTPHQPQENAQWN